ncbi:MAG: glycosyltransferase family protein [Planctomycetota bacterium]
MEDVAPVRVGFSMESLEYSKQELENHPHLKGRRQFVENQMCHMTHILACDEADAERINAQGLCKALWFPTAVPEKFLAAAPVVHQGKAVFCGSVYRGRDNWLKDRNLRSLLVSSVSKEHHTGYPALFDDVNRKCMDFLQQNRAADEAFLLDYLNILRRVRRECFKLWLTQLQTGSAIVNLPHLFKSYAGRVVEAMAAGRPVISWQIPDRPRTSALFEDGKEILLFDQSRPEQLANHIQHIQNDPDFARRIAENALHKVAGFHTAEERIRQVLDWIETGTEPVFSEIEQNLGLKQGRREPLAVGAIASEQDQSSEHQINLDNLIELADVAANRGEYNNTAQYYHKALKCYPDNVSLWNSMGRSARKAGDLVTAQTAFGCAQTLSSNDNSVKRVGVLQKREKDGQQSSSFFVQRVSVRTIDDRINLFRKLCENKKVLHIGCTDNPIFEPETNLHIQLSKFCRQLDGYDIDTQGLELLKQYVPGKYFNDVAQIRDSYDIMLIPETIEHVDDVKSFLEQLSKIEFKKCLITAPNSFLPNDNGNHLKNDGVYVEYVHPDHNCWFSPYTLKNCIQKFTDWNVLQTYLLNNKSMVACLCENVHTWRLSKIPKKMHVYWGNQALSFLRYLTVYSFRKLNPDWQINIYIPSEKYKGAIPWETGELYDGVTFEGKDYSQELFSSEAINIKEVDFSNYPFIKDAPENYKSDLFRWFILSEEGGLYSDFDILYFEPMSNLFFNTEENKNLDLAVCLQKWGHIIGFLLSAPDNPFFKKLLLGCEKFFNTSSYQSISAPMVNKVYPAIHYIRRMFPDLVIQNMPMDVVYAVNHTNIPVIFCSNDLSVLKPETIGIHWYAGHKVSQQFNNELTDGNFLNYDNIIVQKIKEIYP